MMLTKLPTILANPKDFDEVLRVCIFVNAAVSFLGSTKYNAAFLSASNSTFTSMRRNIRGREKPQQIRNMMEKAKISNEGKKA